MNNATPDHRAYFIVKAPPEAPRRAFNAEQAKRWATNLAARHGQSLIVHPDGTGERVTR